jgi:hypothetical protein
MLWYHSIIHLTPLTFVVPSYVGIPSWVPRVSYCLLEFDTHVGLQDLDLGGFICRFVCSPQHQHTHYGTVPSISDSIGVRPVKK